MRDLMLTIMGHEFAISCPHENESQLRKICKDIEDKLKLMNPPHGTSFVDMLCMLCIFMEHEAQESKGKVRDENDLTKVTRQIGDIQKIINELSILLR